MAKVTLYTGGCRSGKSHLAVQHAKELSDNVCFIATCNPQDDEMKERVKKHQNNRPKSWRVLEEPIDIASAIQSVDSDTHPVILIDCLTLWVCNLMCDQAISLTTEKQVKAEAEKLIDASKKYDGNVIIVTNEVGMGIMPTNEMARNYADLAGRCNQTIAKHADKVVFVSCGLPIVLKQE